jgi:hypothetical protein
MLNCCAQQIQRCEGADSWIVYRFATTCLILYCEMNTAECCCSFYNNNSSKLLCYHQRLTSTNLRSTSTLGLSTSASTCWPYFTRREQIPLTLRREQYVCLIPLYCVCFFLSLALLRPPLRRLSCDSVLIFFVCFLQAHQERVLDYLWLSQDGMKMQGDLVWAAK